MPTAFGLFGECAVLRVREIVVGRCHKRVQGASPEHSTPNRRCGGLGDVGLVVLR